MNDRTVNPEDCVDEGGRHCHYRCKHRKLIGLALIACAIGVSISAALVVSQKGSSRGNESTTHLKGSKLYTIIFGTTAISSEADSTRRHLKPQYTTREPDLEIVEGQNIALLGKCEGDCDSDDECEV